MPSGNMRSGRGRIKGEEKNQIWTLPDCVDSPRRSQHYTERSVTIWSAPPNMAQFLRKTTKATIGVLTAGSLAACSFEPPLRLPSAPTDKTPYTANSAPEKTLFTSGRAGTGQQFLYGKTLDGEWWQLFHSSALNALVATGLQNSPTVAQAQAQLKEAEASARINASIFYPQVNGTLQANRSKASAAAFGGNKGGFHYSLITGSLDVTYYPDIFGVNKLVYRNSEALVQYQRWELEAARLTLSGNIVTAAVNAAATQAQIAATHSIIAHEHELLTLTENRYRAGAVPYLNVVNQQSQLAGQMATLPPLEQQLSVYRHQLAILVGEFPAQSRIPQFRLASITLPGKIPVSLPSTLLKQRPDIQAALAQMKAANAKIGEARAQFYPTVQLSAAIGSTASQPGLFFNPFSSIWSLVGSLAQPIFQGGKLEAQESEANAAYEVTYQQYRATVLGAFEQVADSLRALEHDAETLKAEEESLGAARQALKLSEASYRAGAIDYLSLLASQIQYSTAKIAVVRAKSQRYQDTAALLVALGGGWWSGQPAVAEPPEPVQMKASSPIPAHD